MPPTRILVAGASGFVGRSLVPALVDAGHEVRAMTRRPEDYDGPGLPVRADVALEDELVPAMRGCTVAYYLVHSLDQGDFDDRDAEAAETFGRAARRAGVERIVYLGGLGDDQEDLSPHLRSRHEVEGMLAADGVPVTTLRAGIVVGDSGTSWEMIRSMVDLLPVLAVPTWALTLTQPIAIDDVVRYLVGVLDAHLGSGSDTHPRDGATYVYEIGGSEVLRYIDLLSRVYAVRGRPGLVVPVPLPAKRLATRIAARVMPFVTGVDAQTIRTLLESMRNEVIVRDDRIRDVVDFEPMDYDESVRVALLARDRRRRGANLDAHAGTDPIGDSGAA